MICALDSFANWDYTTITVAVLGNYLYIHGGRTTRQVAGQDAGWSPGKYLTLPTIGISTAAAQWSLNNIKHVRVFRKYNMGDPNRQILECRVREL